MQALPQKAEPGGGGKGQIWGDHTDYHTFWEHLALPQKQCSCAPTMAAAGLWGLPLG